MSTWQLPAFEELHELGSGGSGRVVLARHQPTGTEVAIKYLADWLADDAELLAGFRAEAQLMAGLVDPQLVTLYEYVETTSGAAIVMDVLDGVSLRRLLDEGGPLSPEAALTLLKGSLLGLAMLHRQGVAHRDYKPDNVIVSDAGGTTLIDYGIAAPVGEIAAASGTPRYMAPEQWRGEPSSAATDVYAATATFVECLTGHPVFSGETVPHLLYQHLHAPPPLDEVPEAVRPLALAGLVKDPTDRIADAAELVEQLDAVALAAYGEQWEAHGRSHLAARAALLAFLFAHPRAVGVQAAQAQTDLGTSSTSPSSRAAEADDSGESIGSAGRSAEVHAAGVARSVRHVERLGVLRSRRLTLSLGLLLILTAVLGATRLTGSSYASTAAFDTGAATRGVVTMAPAAPGPSPFETPTAAPQPTTPPPTPPTTLPPAPSTTAPPSPRDPEPPATPTATPVVEPTRSPAAPPTVSPPPRPQRGVVVLPESPAPSLAPGTP